MAFIYIPSPSGTKLEPKEEEKLLEQIDNFDFPLNGYKNLAQLHSRITVELSDKNEEREYSYELTPTERNHEIEVLKKRIKEEKKRKHKEWEENVNLIRLNNKLRIYTNAVKGSNGNYPIRGTYKLLGVYLPMEKKVVLYYKNIHQYPNPKELLGIVYVHEMMHAYLDLGYNYKEYFAKIEEPIVEYAMLCFFKAFGNSICKHAEEHVKEKQQVLGLAHYGFGYCLFNNPNGVDWLEDYRNAKNTLVKTDLNVAKYLDYWKTGVYPEEKEKECIEELYKALHKGSSKKIIVKHTSKGVYEQSKNKNDLIRKLDGYLALHSPIAPLAIPVTPSVHENRLYKWWSNSSARQYFNWLDPNKHPELIPLLNKHGLYGSIYNCIDLKQITNIYKELVDKTTPEAINAYGHNENMVSAIRHFIEHLLDINGIIL